MKVETLEWLKEEALKEDTSIGGIIDELVDERRKNEYSNDFSNRILENLKEIKEREDVA